MKVIKKKHRSGKCLKMSDMCKNIITAHPIRLTVILVTMSVSVVILYYILL